MKNGREEGICEWLCKCLYNNKQNLVSNNKNFIELGKTNTILNKSNQNDRERIELENKQNNESILRETQQNLLPPPIINEIPVQIESNKIKESKNKFEIFSKYKINEIKYAPEYSKENKFNCPICLNYSNAILKLSCCKNHICHLCANDYLETGIKYNYPLNCSYCGIGNQNIILEDVNLEEPLKFYMDSPVNSFKKTMTHRFKRISFGETKNSKNKLIEENVRVEDICFDVDVIDDISHRVIVLEEINEGDVIGASYDRVSSSILKDLGREIIIDPIELSNNSIKISPDPECDIKNDAHYNYFEIDNENINEIQENINKNIYELQEENINENNNEIQDENINEIKEERNYLNTNEIIEVKKCDKDLNEEKINKNSNENNNKENENIENLSNCNKYQRHSKSINVYSNNNDNKKFLEYEITRFNSV